MVTRSEAIKSILKNSTVPDLASLYNLNMEVQVNVAQDGGERVAGEYRGKTWTGWTDGIQTWKSFRIPLNASTNPEYTDRDLTFDLAKHVEAIGMTGWDWQAKLSRWVAFDFDSIIGHSDKHIKKLSDVELREIRQVVTNIPWVTARQSTGGKGLHLYVFLDPVSTQNHTEHAALARSIIGMLSAVTGYDFSSKVDVCGGNIWVWRRNMIPGESFKLLKQGEKLQDIPANWRDHLTVISGKRKKSVPSFISEGQRQDVENLFEELSGQRPRNPLDEEHKKLITYLQDIGAAWWWNQDHGLLVTHTYDLRRAHGDLGFRGIFETISSGREHGVDHNCFCYPLRRGAWVIRRFTPGTAEAPTWEQDGNGWTTCYYNQQPDLKTAARSNEGLEQTSGGFVFRDGQAAVQAALALGVNLKLPTWAYGGRRTVLKEHKDGRLIMEIDHNDNDRADEMPGWLAAKGKWTRIFNTKINSNVKETEVGNYDDIVRHLITEGNEDFGWMIKGEDGWKSEPLLHIKPYLESLGITPKELKQVLGSCIAKPWKVVNLPFEPEFVGDRKWNRDAAQIKFAPSESEVLTFPHWNKILQHCGGSLDHAVRGNGWAKANGILTGADYLKCWMASMFQKPTEPLPYLFFYGPQNSGKSIFHESLERLITSGVRRADAALISQSGFNAELEHAVLCVIEETDLRGPTNKQAYNRIKDWVTSPQLAIHKKGSTPYTVRNTTHWIQCSNEKLACPLFPGDSRIVMVYVPEIEPIDMIPKRLLLQQLEKEASDFVAELLRLEIPESNDRLNLPVIETDDKIEAEQANRSFLEIYLDEHCYEVTGKQVKFSELFEGFKEWLDPHHHDKWTKIRVGRELPYKYPRGRSPKDNQLYVGNIAFAAKDPSEPVLPKLIIRDGKLVTE